MRSDKASPLMLSARSNALQFYTPLPRATAAASAGASRPLVPAAVPLAAWYRAPDSQRQLDSAGRDLSEYADDAAYAAIRTSHTAPRTYRSLLEDGPAGGPRPASDSRLRQHSYETPAVRPRATGGRLRLPSAAAARASPKHRRHSAPPSPYKHPKLAEASVHMRHTHKRPPVSPTKAGKTTAAKPATNPLGKAAAKAPARADPPRSSAASVRSLAPSFRSRTSIEPRRRLARPVLDALPAEILDCVCSYLPQKDLLAVVRTSRALAASAYGFLYHRPQFTTSYRFAQFVSVVARDASLAALVRVLDLSRVESRVLADDIVLAGWRDWKYRSEPLYSSRRYLTEASAALLFRDTDARPTLSRSSSTSSTDSAVASPPTPPTVPLSRLHFSSRPSAASSHPLQSPLLKQYSLSRDIPAGALLHVLRACEGLRHVNLSNLPLAADYRIAPHKRPTFEPSTTSGDLFVSDVPKFYTWSDNETVSVSVKREVVDALLALSELETLKLRKLVWVTKDVAVRLAVHACTGQRPVLTFVDLRECGMTRDVPWAVRGEPSALQTALVDAGLAERPRPVRDDDDQPDAVDAIRLQGLMVSAAA
ncbi:uncharacterized protein V1510DRAFT_419797 [Dipodascopsis tothii]|uniref:uncharacterized protein n=1 Tax=Dipodascopsis tothii TaxID=44089 RepID=UPI0034CE3815